MENQYTTSYWFIFYKDQLLVEKIEGGYTIPVGEDAPIPVTSSLEIGELQGVPCRVASVDAPVEETEQYEQKWLRATWGLMKDKFYKMAGKAYQIKYWDENSRFCPACGTGMEQKSLIMKQCPTCGKEVYPTISAAILVLIRKGDSILLVHARNFNGPFYSLVAGFLEAGETLEECVVREVMEETGLKITNISYWGNQPWPYPSTQMIGFVADYVSGELHLQDEELSSGAFYTKDNLPQLPRKVSLARRMIDWWLEQS